MPIYTIELDDGRRVRVEADNPDAALAAAQGFQATGQREFSAQDQPLAVSRRTTANQAFPQGIPLTEAQRRAYAAIPDLDISGQSGTRQRPFALPANDDGSNMQVGTFGITADGRLVEGRAPRPVALGGGPSPDQIQGMMETFPGNNPISQGIDNAAGVAASGLDTFYRSIPGMSELSAGIETGVRAGGDFLSGNPVAPLSNYWQDARLGQQSRISRLAEQNPVASNLITGTGYALPALIPGGQGLAATRAGATVGQNVLRGAAGGAATGTISGGIYGYAQPGSLEERSQAAVQGMTGGALLGGAVGGIAGRFMPRDIAAEPRMPEASRAMLSQGIDLTPGQMLGGAARANEEKLRSVPGLGDAITAAEERGMAQFNRMAVNRTLAPIGQQLPENVQTGRPAIAFAQQQLGREFDNIAANATLRADEQLASDLSRGLAGISENMIPERRQQLQDIINSTVLSRVTQSPNGVSGRTLQDINNSLRTNAGEYMASGDPDQRMMGRALESVRRAIDSAMLRQNPQLRRQIAAARQGYARLPRIERAAASAGAREGIATPNQFAAAGRAEDRTLRRRATAAGRVPDQQLFENAQTALSNRVPDSGTPGRGALIAAVGGLMTAAANPATIPYVAGTGATIGLAASAYSPQALSLLNKMARQRMSMRDAAIARQQLEGFGISQQQQQQLVEEIRRRASAGIGASAAPTNTVTAPVGMQ